MAIRLEIITPRLVLRPLEMADAGDLFAYARDEEVARHTSWPAHRTIRDAEEFLARVVPKQDATPGRFRVVWAIRTTANGPGIGTICLIQDSPETAHTDYALARDYWGRGLMTEAVSAVAAWGFERLPELKTLRSGCLTRNIGSRRVLEKSGFRLDGIEQVTFGVKFDHQTLSVSNFSQPRTQ